MDNRRYKAAKENRDENAFVTYPTVVLNSVAYLSLSAHARMLVKTFGKLSTFAEKVGHVLDARDKKKKELSVEISATRREVTPHYRRKDDIQAKCPAQRFEGEQAFRKSSSVMPRYASKATHIG
jgi:hypothetical protein